jgi:hypothetical protein
VIAAALALALGAAPVLAQDWEPGAWDDEEERRPRLFLSVWGGEALDGGGSGGSSAVLGGEAAWAFDALDLGVAGYGYRRLEEAEREWTPVALVRIGQRFQTRRGLEAIFAFGIGAGRPDDWVAWYQVALGVRATFGPLFLGGELAFERYELLRLTAGLGLAF